MDKETLYNVKLEITWELLKEVIRKKGIHFSQNLSEELKSLSERTLISVEGYQEVLREIVQELVDEQFGKPKEQ